MTETNRGRARSKTAKQTQIQDGPAPWVQESAKEIRGIKANLHQSFTVHWPSARTSRSDRLIRQIREIRGSLPGLTTSVRRSALAT